VCLYSILNGISFMINTEKIGALKKNVRIEFRLECLMPEDLKTEITAR
jgi:hypothetical protein